MNRNLLASLIGLGLLAVCTRAPLAKPDIPQTEEECLAVGGNWIHLGLPGTPKRCDLKAKDGGKSCTDSSQCQGECMAPSGASEGQKMNGACSDYILNFGCARRVENGKVGIEICAD